MNKNNLVGLISRFEAPLPSNPIAELASGLSQAERRRLAKQKKRLLIKEKKEMEKQKRKRKQAAKKIISGFIIAFFIGGAAVWLVKLPASRPSLPPQSSIGHSEDVPPSHILSSPIPDSVQRHMLEHAEGRGKPGVIIQYNCQDFVCDEDLVRCLKELAQEYPDIVYLAPNNYDGKIILTKEGKREILDNFDAEKIRKFIEN